MAHHQYIRRIVAELVFFVTSAGLWAQSGIFSNKVVLNEIKAGIDKTYNAEFPEAERIFRDVELHTKGSPAGPLLFGLLYYYEYAPLTPESPGAKPFVDNLNEAISLASKILDKNKNDVEVLAMDMIARALLNMYYVDNGNSMKAIPEIMPIYRTVMKGFTLKDQFNEFYFTTGLYNYYRDAYPEAHPVYKPIAALLRSGNKAEGLRQLHYAADSCIFLRNEALVFLKIIYLNYENDPAQAFQCMQRLNQRFPNNLLFVAGCAETLIMNRQYEQAKPYLYILFSKGKKDMYAMMKAFILKGIYEEKVNRNYATAEKDYLTGLKIAASYGSTVDAYKVYAYYGLSRIYRIQGKIKESQEYRKKGESLARYKYFSRLD